MADVFLREDARKLMRGKKLLFLGDSILRNIYQDLLWLLENGTHTPAESLKKKGVMMDTFCCDKLVPGTGELDPGRKYWEVREFKGGDKLGGMTATFVFLTRCFSERLEDFIYKYKTRNEPPDLVLVLSALWDINRWGPDSIPEYVENCPKLLTLLSAVFPQSTQVIWLTSPPISVDVWGGFLLEGLEFQKRSMRFNVMEANMMVANNAVAFSQDALDLHYWMSHQIHKRMSDGIHWTADAVRMQLNIILTHFCLSRDIPLPNRWGGERNSPLESAQKFAKAANAGPVSFVRDPNWTAPTKRPWSERLGDDGDNQERKKRRFDSPDGRRQDGPGRSSYTNISPDRRSDWSDRKRSNSPDRKNDSPSRRSDWTDRKRSESPNRRNSSPGKRSNKTDRRSESPDRRNISHDKRSDWSDRRRSDSPGRMYETPGSGRWENYSCPGSSSQMSPGPSSSKWNRGNPDTSDIEEY